MTKSIIAALVAAAALAACGGGGGASPAPPVPTATPSTGSLSIHFAIIGAGESANAGATVSALRRLLGRHVLDTVAQEPVEIAAQLCNSTAASCELSQVATAGDSSIVIPQVINSSGSPVPEASPPAISSQNTADAAVATPSVAPSASPEVQVTADTSSPVQTAISVTYPGVSGSLPVNIYQNAGLQCPTADAYAATGFTASGGSLVPASSLATADIYFTGAECPGAYASTGDVVLNVPDGAVWISDGTPIADVMNGPTSFTGTPFTTMSFATIEADPTDYAILLAKTASGGYVKLRVSSAGCQAGNGCGNAILTGLALVSDGSGAFAY
ncbi:MAG: hypothetical protein ABSD03_16260 [Vulcanimicrobiaceae bacterium]